jgi:predicted XRE-type DNA-binding protein
VILRAKFRDYADPVPGEFVSAAARMLALAYGIEAAVEREQYRSVAEVARALGVSRARLSQLMRRRWTPVDEQEQALNPPI